jgi:hypothetical protein
VLEETKMPMEHFSSKENGGEGEGEGKGEAASKCGHFFLPPTLRVLD